MNEQHTDFYKYVDNFAKTAHIPSISIFESNMESFPSITIAIPTYKRADFLREAIDSAVNQIEYVCYDILVVDNNPERECETEKIMIAYDNPIISYYKNAENIGMVGNWNRLFTLAKGEYVVMLHDDDLLMPTFLKDCMTAMKSLSCVGMLKPKSISFYDGDKILNKNIINPKEIKMRRLYDISNYYGFIMGAPSCCIFNKKYVLEFGGFNQEFYPTMDLYFASFFSTKHKVYILNKSLSLYRWSVNESLKLSTLEKFVINDYYFRYKLLTKYKLPKWFIKRYLSGLIRIQVKLYKTINSEFTFDLNTLGLAPTKYWLSTIYLFFMRAYAKIIICSKDLINKIK